MDGNYVSCRIQKSRRQFGDILYLLYLKTFEEILEAIPTDFENILAVIS